MINAPLPWKSRPLFFGICLPRREGVVHHIRIGGGRKAVFQLESNVNPQDDSLSDSGRFFGSEAYASLQTQFRTLTPGRRNAPLFDKLVSTYDPLTYANYP
jgi:predicted porin